MQIVLHDGRKFPAQPAARHAVAGAHEGADKSWALYVFSSANAIRKYTHEELVELGVSWIWMGLESPHSGYCQAAGAPTRVELTRELRAHGIKVLGSTIVGLEHHTPENIVDEIEHAVSHETDFHQFMLYTPVPGRRSYQEMRQQAGCSTSIWPTSTASTNSISSMPPFRATIPSAFSTAAFQRDFERNGPSLYRICRTTLQGWKRYKNDPDLRVRERFRGRFAPSALPIAACCGPWSGN